MEIGIGVWAFVVYLAVVIVWNAVIKRSITEAMLLGFLVAAAFGGIDNYITTVVEAFCAAATDELFVATLPPTPRLWVPLLSPGWLRPAGPESLPLL